MKNIHVLPTDKPTGIFKLNDSLLFSIINKVRSNNEGFHLYITSDEKIKKRDWCINSKNNNVMKVGHHGHHGYSSKKIILTTDTDLIKDGVQAIDDEFLEWFVKNPSCESVEVISNSDYEMLYKVGASRYKIIIPSEEPKQKNTADYIDRHIVQAMVEVAKQNLYNEEEVQVKLYECLGHFAQKHNIIINGSEIDQWFEQFKKEIR